MSEQIEIEFVNVKLEQNEVIEKWVRSYAENNSGVTINYTAPTDGETVVQTRMAANDTPDMFTEYPTRPDFKTICKSGHIMEISDAGFWSKVDPNILDKTTLKVDDELYAMPVAMAPNGVFYNTQIFDEHGLVPPKTIAEFYTLCDTLLEEGVTPFVFADQNIYRVAYAYYIAESSLCPDKFEFYDGVANGTITPGIGVNEGQDLTVQFFLDAHEKYGPKDSLGFTGDDANNYLATGKAAMVIANATTTTSLARQINPDANFASFVFPGVKEEDSKVMADIDCSILVASKTAHKDVCYDILDYLVDSDFLREYSEQDGSIPCFTTVNVESPENKVLVDCVKEGGFVVWAHLRWPEEVVNLDHRKAMQDLIATKDVEGFWQEVDNLFAVAR